MNRRDFLTLLSGGTVALAVLPVTNALAPLTSNRWEWIKATGFKPAQDSTQLVGYVIGRRSDGKHYYALGRIGAEEWSPVVVEQTEENLRNTLDTFLHCDCREGFQCDTHRQMFAYAEEVEVEDASV